MSKSTLPWFRFYTETISDTKFDVMAERLGVSKIELFGVWVILLTLASKSPIRGSLFITSTIPYTLEDIAAILGKDYDWMNNVLSEFIRMEMVGNESCYTIKNWNKRQFESDSSTERVREYRERYSNVTVTPPDTDTDTDTELKDHEEEGEKPQESQIAETFQIFEREIGVITPSIRDRVLLLLEEHPAFWVQESFKLSRRNNKPSLAYSEAILKRWAVDGYGTDNRRSPPGGNGNKPQETVAQRMAREEKERLAKGAVA